MPISERTPVNTLDFQTKPVFKELICVQQTYVQNRTRFAKVALYETSQETSVSCTQLEVLYAPFQFGSEYNFLGEFLTEEKFQIFHVSEEQLAICN